jgi:hypothetical protein
LLITRFGHEQMQSPCVMEAKRYSVMHVQNGGWKNSYCPLLLEKLRWKIPALARILRRLTRLFRTLFATPTLRPKQASLKIIFCILVLAGNNPAKPN